MSNEQVINLAYALHPTSEQTAKLSSHEGAVRYAYNYALHHTLTNWANVKNGTEAEYINTTAYAMRKKFNTEKDTIAPWWKENSKEAYNTGFANYQAAIKNYYAKRTGLPRYKTKHLDNTEGITFTTGTRRLEDDRRHFTLPVIGTVRLHERATKLAYLQRHGGRITNVTVKYSRCRWFLTVTVRVSDDLHARYHLLRTKRDKKRSVGVDLGVKYAAVFSDGTVVSNPRSYEKVLRKLRRQQKELSRRKKFDKRTGELASKRYERSKEKVRKTYAKVTNQEVDFAHKLSKRLVDEFTLVGLEDLNVAGMVRNRRLARHIAHAGFGRLRLFTTYKGELYGSEVRFVGRFYPSSKTCSGCGVVKAKLSLSERVFECSSCGVKLDRDLNAALNIEKQVVAQSCGETLNGQGEGSAGSVKPNETSFSELSSESSLSQPDLGRNSSDP